MNFILRHSLSRAVFYALAGAAWTLAFPPYGVLPLFWVGWVFFLWSSIRASARHSFVDGWAWGFGVCWAAFSWLVYTMKSFGDIPVPFGILGTSLYCLYFGLQFGMMGVLIRAIGYGTFGTVLKIATVMTAIDIFFPEHFPWDGALLLAPFPFWLQTLDLWGSVGMTWILCLTATTLWWTFESRLRKIPVPLVTWMPTAAALFVVVSYGFWSWRHWEPLPDAPQIRLVGIQANIGNMDKVASGRMRLYDRITYVMDRYVSMSRSVALESADLIVWPETAMPEYMSSPNPERTRVFALAKDRQIDLLIGSYEARANAVFGEVYNGIFLIDHERGDIVDRYFKHGLLAFGEYVPLAATFPILKQWFSVVSDFTAGPGPAVIHWRNFRIGTSICYEALLPSFVHKLAGMNPDFFLNVTNDSWFGDSREPWFHMYLQGMRMIEYRRSFFRVANTGISAHIDPRGILVSHTEYDTEAVFRGSIEQDEQRNHVTTLYLRAGYLFIRIALALAFFVSIWKPITKFFSSRRQNPPASPR